jgi:hypothetical protein
MEYKDRSIGLWVFGLLTIGLGCLTALMILVIVGAQAMPIPNRPPMATLVPTLGLYGMLAIALTWLGIGSIQAQRWARALLLIFSWSWLLTGIVALTMMALILPSVMARVGSAPQANGQPPMQGMVAGVMVTMFLFEGVIFLVLPAIWTFFYASRHVKATCEYRHPNPCWTDACPLPVLALVLWLAYGAVAMGLMPMFGFTVVPFFGTFVTGWPGAFCFLLVAAVLLGAGVLCYRLDMRGWWLVTMAYGVMMISNLITYSIHDVMDMYRLMHFPPNELAQLQASGFFSGNRILWLTALCMVPFLGYLLFVRRYFSGAALDGPSGPAYSPR